MGFASKEKSFEENKLRKIYKDTVTTIKSTGNINPKFIVIGTTRACIKRNPLATVEDIYRFTYGWAKKQKVNIRKHVRDNELEYLEAIKAEMGSQDSYCY